MDDELRTRYAALVSLFEPADPYEALVKPLVQSAADRHQVNLRPDATYFLLVNLVQMILRPYAEAIPKPPTWWRPGEGPRLLDSYRGLKPPDLVPQIEQALDVIMKELQQSSAEMSAHQVMLAIDRRWKELSIFFMWG